MDAQEKIDYIKELITEKAKISPSGSFFVQLADVVDLEATGGIPDEAPVLFSNKEQWSVIQKLEEEGFIKNVQRDENKYKVWIELSKKKTRRSNVFLRIETVDQFLQDRELFQKFLSMLGDFKSIKPRHRYTYPTDEQNDDLIQLLIDLKIVDYDWDAMKKQTHRAVGNRIIEFSFDGDKIIALNNRVSGKGGRIKKETLELIARDIGDRFTFTKIVDIFVDAGVPESMFIQDTKWRAIFYIFSYYATSSSPDDFRHLLKIIEKVIHPLYSNGDEEMSAEIKKKYNAWLKYDDVSIDVATGKIYVHETDEDNVGGDGWYDTDGDIFEPKNDVPSATPLAELWVLWKQVILVVNLYEDNKALDRNKLEKIYLELIYKAEQLIKGKALGGIKEIYKRPFSSLSTANIEARAKGAEDGLELVSTFMVAIATFNPDPAEVQKAMTKNSELIEKVASATQAIGDEKINVSKLSYSQALFILRMVMSQISNILEAVAGGYILFGDPELNARYIPLMDTLSEILNRKDFEKLKQSEPNYLPEHLFQDVDEMDVWWENGGQSSIISFIGDIESAWVRDGQQVFPISISLNKQFSETNNAIVNHKKTKQQKWSQIERNIDRQKQEGAFDFGEKSKDKKEEPSATKENTEPPIQKIIHEHRFVNSIQEKEIALNYKQEKSGTTGFYIIKKDDDFFYKGRFLNLSKKTDYYRVFCALFAKCPDGGEIGYQELISEVKSRIPKTKLKTDEEIKKFIQDNLTGKKNGFLRYAGTTETEDNGKPLIITNRGVGIIFNNKAG